MDKPDIKIGAVAADNSRAETREFIAMMRRCSEEIRLLRRQIGELQPKAEAYDNLACVLGLLPRQRTAAGEDLVWSLEKRIKELISNPAVE